MIQLDTNNGHDKDVINEFNKVSKLYSDEALLRIILTYWADNDDLQSITKELDK